MSLSALMAVGLLLGMGHALDADHVVAVSTIVSESRSLLRSLLIGVVWGIGHTATLLVVGLFVLFFGITPPPWVAISAEFLVGLILIILGVQILWRYSKKRIYAHYHDHGDGIHIHFHTHEVTQGHTHEHHGPHTRKPLFVGAVHGLAGSAAVMLLVLSTIQSPLLGALCILTFGLGSILGMLVVSALIGFPFLLTAGRFQRLHAGARVVAGLVSIAVGCSISVESFRLW
ncbi:MAG: sulfite exporter TauE/SafE family protein [Candidatus Methylomirabilales bacterium]